ncbi:MAG: histidine kinase [Bacteroidota bacterium]
MWFFTNYGTMKYNGKEFRQVLKNLPFKESFIYSYYENDNGQIWVANSNAKIYEVKNDSAFLIKGTEEISELLNLKASEITEIFVDKENNIYISSKYNGFKLIKSKGYKAVSLSNYDDADSVFVYVLDIEGHVFNSNSFNYRRRVKNFMPGGNFVFRYINEENPRETYTLKFWGSSKSISPTSFKRFKKDIYFTYGFNLLKAQPYGFIKTIPFNSYILNYTQDKKGHLWVGVLNSGLYELDKNDSIINHYFGNETINHVFIDSQNGLWLSTEGSGVFHCSNPEEMHFREFEIFNSGISFIKKIDDKLFIANRTGDICLIDKGKMVSTNLGNDNSGSLDIIKYHSDYIVYSRKQVRLLKIKDKLVISDLPTILPGFLPLNVLKLNGDTLLCFSRNRFTIVNNGVAGIRNSEINVNGYLDHRIFSCASRKNEKLIGTNDGVYLFIKNKLMQPDFLAQTKDSKIVSIVEGNKGEFWFCTQGNGLFKLDASNKLVHYSTVDGLPSDIINNISFDWDNHIILSTNKGLYESLDLKKWDKLYSGQVKSAFECNNKVYLLAENKLTIIDKSQPANKPSVYFNLASIFLNGKNATLNDISLLKYDENNLTFNFDVISYSSGVPDIIYNLKGDKGNWIKTSDQRIVFQNLPPGDYKLTAGLASTHINARLFIIPFTICKPFWLTGWFIFLYVLSGFAMVAFVGWRVLTYYKIRENKRNAVQQQISEYKLIALKAQINPHFMSNCLTAIQHLIFNNKVDEANEYLAKFSLLVRQVLNFSSKPLVTLREELEIASINIELEQLRFENKFVYDINFDRSLDIQYVFVPPLILQPIIENAIWHGLLPLKRTRQGKLQIKIHVDADLLYISIEDNGVGRKKTEASIGNLKESKGMDITRQRIQNLNVYYNSITADLVYEDLVDNQANAIGTRVRVVLPLNLVLRK